MARGQFLSAARGCAVGRSGVPGGGGAVVCGRVEHGSERCPVRAWFRRHGRSVRVAADALLEQRLPGRLGHRDRLRLDVRDREPRAGVRPDRRHGRGSEAADGSREGRHPRPFARDVGHAGLSRQLHRARGERGALREHRRPRGGCAPGGRPDARHLGRPRRAGPPHRRCEERDDPEPDPRPVGDLGGVVRRVLQVLHRQRTRARPRPADRYRQARRPRPPFPGEPRRRGRDDGDLAGRRRVGAADRERAAQELLDRRDGRLGTGRRGGGPSLRVRDRPAGQRGPPPLLRAVRHGATRSSGSWSPTRSALSANAARAPSARSCCATWSSGATSRATATSCR